MTGGGSPEMEFLDIKTRAFCSMLFSVPSSADFTKQNLHFTTKTRV
jgi:hypothetical protein